MKEIRTREALVAAAGGRPELAALRVVEVDLTGANLGGYVLRHVVFERCKDLVEHA